VQDTTEPLTNTYALKTYLTPDAKKYYENEVATFRRLRRKQNSGLIGFYGCYVQANAFSIILEFADKGDLENYFRTTSPPVREDDILSFWESIFRTVWALECVHNVETSSTNHRDPLRIMHGYYPIC
jgi:serine/threonine protein kinase